MPCFIKRVTATAVFVTLGCLPAANLPEESRAAGSPAAVIVLKTISGEILGNDLNQPAGLTVDFRGNIFLSDAGNDRVVKFDNNLVPIGEIGGQGIQEGLLDEPSFLHIDNGLNLIVAERGNRRLSRFDSRLNFVDVIFFEAFDDPTRFGYPSGVAVADFGEIWVADHEKNRLVIFDNLGKFDRFAGDFGHSGGPLSRPEKLVIDDNGRIIVCDAGNKRLMIYDEYGNYLSRIHVDGLEYPQAVAIDGANLWLLDGHTGVLFYLDRGGYTLFRVGPAIPGSDKILNRPSDIVLLDDNRLLISDSGNNRLLLCRIIRDEHSPTK